MNVLHVVLVLGHVVVAAAWFGIGLRLPSLSRAILAAPPDVREALRRHGDKTIREMTGMSVVFYALALAAFFVGGGFSAYGPVYHAALGLGLVLVLLHAFGTRPTWRRFADGDDALRGRFGGLLGLSHGLWLALLVLMFFGPRWSSAWGV